MDIIAKYLPYLLIAVISYLLGGIPFAYILTKSVSGKDLTEHGTSNIGAMNVKRTTGSWLWFAVDVILDGGKGLNAVLIAKALSSYFGLNIMYACYVAIFFAVMGHNYSIYMLPIKGKIIGGKGLATGGGAILGYNWSFLVVATAIALVVIFATKYLLAGQITVTIALPIYVWFVSPKDFPLVTLVCAIIFLKHAPRIPGLLTGKEPKWNVKDYKEKSA